MQDSRLQQAGVYTEFGGLNALKSQAHTDKKAALKQVAKQFESLFVSEMLKSMRSANKVLSEGNYLHSSQSEFYQNMFDSQLSLSLSEHQGFGLSEVLVRQMSRQIPGMTPEGERRSGHLDSITDYDRSLPAISPKLPQELSRVKDLMAETPETDRSSTDNRPAPARFDSPAQFVEHLLPIARRVAADTDVDPRVMIAQAALETGWGRHMIEAGDETPSHNLFGIKADQRWQGDAVTVATTEYRDGVPMTEQAAFRSYADYESSFRDYLSFLKSNPRYRDALASASDPAQFADKLQAAGYATDPAYGDKIRRIMSGASFEAAAGASGLNVSGSGE